jgi:hypothetical protein
VKNTTKFYWTHQNYNMNLWTHHKYKRPHQIYKLHFGDPSKGQWTHQKKNRERPTKKNNCLFF